ncbi:MAG: hypothetical protein P4L50_28240 [Anaerolineaceae bacterium]|nr:hypothetical protein [Anaerolineaceae bacterium]
MINIFWNKIFLGITLSLFILTACSGNSLPEVQNTPLEKGTQPKAVNTTRPVPKVTPIPSHTFTPVPSPLVIQPSQLQTVDVMPVIPAGSNVIVSCLKIQSTLPSLDGVLPITPLDNFRSNPSYFLDLKSGNKQTIVNERTKFLSPQVSPGGQWVAYTSANESGSNNLEIASSDGKILHKISMAQDWWWYFWLNNTHLLIDEGNHNPADFILLNPFTGDRIILKSQYPGLYTYGTDPVWGRYEATVYNPSQKLVVYAALIHEFAGYILWDMEKQQEITRIPVSVLGSAPPSWSLDGSLFAISPSPQDVPDGIQIYNQSGKLVDQYDLSAFLQNFYPYIYSWAPDAHYLAFTISKNENNVSTGLGILNLKNNEITLLCLPDQAINYEVNNIVWSPDDQNLVIENGDSQSNKVLLINLPNKTAVQIAENSDVGGWMVEPSQ